MIVCESQECQPVDERDGVYVIKSRDCFAFYIGETFH